MTQSLERSAGQNGGHDWVAIVDDDGSIRTALARVLRMEGWRVATFGTAHEYLAASALEGAPSCLVLDVHLGSASQMSGFELHDHLAASGANVKTILMTAHDEVPATDLACRVGADNYLRKPFESEMLISLVRRALGSSWTS
jgi:FixJ family two-component response regulator